MSQSYRSLIDEVEQVVLYLINTGKMPEKQRIEWEEVKERAKNLPMEDVWAVYSNFASQFQEINFQKLSTEINTIYDKIRDYYSKSKDLTTEQLKVLQQIKERYDVEDSNPDKELKELENFFNYVEVNKPRHKEQPKEQKTKMSLSEIEEQIGNYFKAFNYLRSKGKMNNKAYTTLTNLVTIQKDKENLYSEEALKELQDFYYSYDFPSLESILVKVREQFSPKLSKKK